MKELEDFKKDVELGVTKKLVMTPDTAADTEFEKASKKTVHAHTEKHRLQLEKKAIED